MPTVVWPASLPQNPFIGYEEAAEPNVVTTEVGSGPPKSRRRSTRERVFQATPMEFTGAQKATFEAFWLNINQGASPFEWQDMATGDTVEFKFINGRKPKFRNLTPGSTTNNRLYGCVLELERL